MGYRYRQQHGILASERLLVMIVFVGLLGAGTAFFGPDRMSKPYTGLNASCDIKGNVSQSTGERIYHVPGQKYYEQTHIQTEFGERWFCSEAEARAAGWRKSRV
jgi:hypothetical protein